jgi:hypothetical protein
MDLVSGQEVPIDEWWAQFYAGRYFNLQLNRELNQLIK